jgi:hypothetical protein
MALENPLGELERAQAELARVRESTAAAWSDELRRRFDQGCLDPMDEAVCRLMTALRRAQDQFASAQRILSLQSPRHQMDRICATHPMSVIGLAGAQIGGSRLSWDRVAWPARIHRIGAGVLPGGCDRQTELLQPKPVTGRRLQRKPRRYRWRAGPGCRIGHLPARAGTGEAGPVPVPAV